MSPVSWRRHSCLLGRDSGLLISWNWVEPGGGARLQPAADFSPPSAGLTSLAGGRAEARGPLWGRLKSAPPSKRSPASGGPKWLPLFPRANRNCGRHQESRDSSRPSSRAASIVPERREESRRRRHECLRHVMAQVNSPNYPKSPADIRSSESAGRPQEFGHRSGVAGEPDPARRYLGAAWSSPLRPMSVR
jgi:hypothetical protein